MTRVSPRIVLASASSARRVMLSGAGIEFAVQPSSVDEVALKAQCSTGGMETAARLAEAKAIAVSIERPDDYVIGSDQVLHLEGRLLSKPASLEQARHQLEELRGRTHELYAAVALAQSGKVVWQTCSVARLTMRQFSDTFLQGYLEQEGEPLCSSVGAYRLEGLGIQLFSAIEGDYHTILGMPLLPLLTELRKRSAIED